MKVHEMNTDLEKGSSFQLGVVLDECASSVTRGTANIGFLEDRGGLRN